MSREREKLEAILAEIREESSVTNQIVENIVGQYTKQLDELVTAVQSVALRINNREIDEYESRQLESDILNISALMYFAGRELAFLGGQSDVAKARKTELLGKVLAGATGKTAAERRGKAEQYIEAEQMMEDIFKRAYDTLKMKLENADRVFTSLKKVYSKQMLELEVFRKELGKGKDK